MEINNALDILLKEKQENCDHPYQDRMVTSQGVFCGLCNKEEIIKLIIF